MSNRIYTTPIEHKNVNLSETPFDSAAIIFPKITSTPYVLTPDLPTGNALTIQPTGQANSQFAFMWNGDSVVNHSSADSGTGNVQVNRFSNSDNLFLTVFNSYNADAHNDQGVMWNYMANAVFNIKYWNSHDTGQFMQAEGCFFTNQANMQINRGSNNAQEIEQWSYTATDWYRSPGSFINDPSEGQDASNIVSAFPNHAGNA